MQATRPPQAGVRVAAAAKGGTADETLFSNDNLLKLLAAIRGSAIEKNRKMELRDLVLEFSQSHDETLRAQLKAAFSEHQKELGAALGLGEHSSAQTSDVPVSSPAAPRTGLSAPIGRPRAQPVFGVAARSPEAMSAASQKEAAPVEEKKTAPVEMRKEAHVNEPILPPRQKKPDVAPALSVQPKQEGEVPAAVPTSAPDVPLAGPPPPFEGDAKQRILAIKRSINDRVGNPVNLVEADREIGQEYMAALLDAIKQSSGAGGRVGSAMERLEAVYRRAEELFASGTIAAAQDDAKGVPPPSPTPPLPSPAPSVQSVETPKRVPEPPAPARTPVSESSPQPVPKPSAPPVPPKREETSTEEPVAPPAASVPPRSAAGERTVPLRTMSTAPDPSITPPHHTEAPVSQPDARPAAPRVPQKQPVESASVAPSPNPMRPAATKPIPTAPVPSAPERPRNASPAPAPQRSSLLHSLADMPVRKPVATKPPVATQREPGTTPRPYAPQPETVAPPHIPENAPIPPQPEPVEESALTDEKVEAGLEQLLSEWKLFRSSGLFGTGPHGSDHPLYKKLARLPLAAVIAGRFEGATPEIKRVIADYMNGWRYEYGIVHKMEEHFEHYLRRVVAVILRMQKSARETDEEKKS